MKEKTVKVSLGMILLPWMCSAKESVKIEELHYIYCETVPLFIVLYQLYFYWSIRDKWYFFLILYPEMLN